MQWLGSPETLSNPISEHQFHRLDGQSCQLKLETICRWKLKGFDDEKYHRSVSLNEWFIVLGTYVYEFTYSHHPQTKNRGNPMTQDHGSMIVPGPWFYTSTLLEGPNVLSWTQEKNTTWRSMILHEFFPHTCRIVDSKGPLCYIRFGCHDSTWVLVPLQYTSC